MTSRRVPVVLQLAASECGHACVRMVLAARGHDVSLGSLRRVLPTGRDGTSLRELADLLRHHGVEGHVAHVDVDTLAGAQTPTILFWNRSHFVVLVAASARGFTVIDPSIGRITVDRTEFGRAYSGACIVIDADEAKPARRARSPRTGSRALPLTRGIPTFFAGVAVGFAPVALSALLSGGSTAVVGGIALAGIAILALLVRIVTARLALSAQRRDGTELFDRMLRLPLSYFDVRAPHELLGRISAADTMRDVRSTDGIAAAMAAGTALGAIGATVAIAPIAALVGGIAAALTVALLFASIAAAHAAAAEEASASRAATSIAATAVQSIAAVKAQGLEERESEAWGEAFARTLRHRRGPRVIAAATSTLRAALLGTGAVVAGWAAAGTTATALAAALGSALIILAATELTERLLRLRSLTHNVDAVADILEEPIDDRPRAEPVTPSAGLQVRDVAFSYAGSRRPTLSDISFDISPGTRVAIVGASGSGKSTLAQLLVGLREPTAGRISLGAQDLSALRRDALAGVIGYVPQSPIVIAGSIRRNIDLGRDGVDEGSVARAAEAAGILAEIEAMPMGFDTILTPSGFGLSGGQHQRIALARALASRPRMLVLDEATSSLEPSAEAAVVDTLSSVVPTLVLVTHRPALAATADLVITLAEGRIARVSTPGDRSSADAPLLGLDDTARPRRATQVMEVATS